MRIALLGNHPPPYGGVSVHVLALAQALRQRGERVQVLDLGEGGHRGPGIWPARGPVRCPWALARAAAAGFLIHVHTSGANPKSWLVALAASRARRPGGPRALLTIHSGLSVAWLERSQARRDLARLACAGCGAVVAVNGQIAAALADAGVPGDRIEVLPAFSPALVEPGPLPAQFAAIRAAHAPLFCAAIAPGPTYGEDLLRRAFPSVRRAHPRAGLVMFGHGLRAGPPGSSEAEGIHDLGELPHGAALSVMQACDAFLRPTRADGDAVSVREALSMGSPVIASAVGHRPAGCTLFPVGDAEALARRMVALAAAPSPPRSVPAATSGPDPFQALQALYQALWAGRPLPSGGHEQERAPTF